MSEQYYVDMAGKTGGPFSLEELRALYQAGTVSTQTLFSKPGSVDWLPLETILPLVATPPKVQQPPVMQAVPQAVHQSVYVTTQRTGKGIKIGIAFSVVGLILSIVFALAYPICWALVFGFFCLMLMFRFLKWFQHE